MQPNYINGTWVPGAAATANINPSDTNDVVGEYARGDASSARDAIAAAREAGPVWAQATPQARADALDAIGSELLARKQVLGELLAREEGKSLPEAVGEAARAGQIFKFFAGEALRAGGEHVPSLRSGITVDVTREPLGVVGIITPWNFPLGIPAWKIAPALAHGNTVVFKPADLVPASAWALTEIISRAGLPAGAFNLVMGRGRDVGQALLESHDVNGISFTGSVATGKSVLMSAASRLAKVQMEMGGKNPLIVLEDADLDVAVECAVQGAYYSTGQRCTASSRLIVDKRIHRRFVEALTARLATLRVGDARDPSTHIGPVVSDAQLRTDLEYIAIGQEEGATLAFGGEQLTRATPGHYLSPALFVDAHNDMRIAREEIFGPVACVIPADGYEHALALANDTEFGLSAGICTTSLKYANHFKRHAQAGMTMTNVSTAGGDYHVPFGGRKASSYGAREQGRYAVEFYTTVKTSYVAA
ncbi:aldehyde dehydrogenase [Pandoraea pnomenusa]|uniref:Aldehyde dehydrogenase, thermostable n=1 Tax=Pandoraea pnomenusa TaxID=93220 RepID=A0A378YX87_9BURK|nr:aldehyde dehydrogenase family protein [Pandoraea pnomenusa]AIU28832.1 aldehyde dehydrogenase [Pandoraea pnomenusa]SUA81413.1 Aldehyde dehydrogenase, thermostable [Pandoraea pnomenusa]